MKDESVLVYESGTVPKEIQDYPTRLADGNHVGSETSKIMPGFSDQGTNEGLAGVERAEKSVEGGREEETE